MAQSLEGVSGEPRLNGTNGECDTDGLRNVFVLSDRSVPLRDIEFLTGPVDLDAPGNAESPYDSDTSGDAKTGNWRRPRPIYEP